MWSLGVGVLSTFFALAITVVIVIYRPFTSKKKELPKQPSGPRAVLVVSDHQFEVPCVALAAATFKAHGMHVVLASQSGGDSTPDKQSLQTKIAKEAGDRQDPVWMEVLNMAHATVPLERIKAHSTTAIFIAGGPLMLNNLRHTDLSGSSPSPFCAYLRRLCVQVHAGGGVIGAVGHGVRGLPDEAELQGDRPGTRRFAGSLDSEVEQVTARMVLARDDNEEPPASE